MQPNNGAISLAFHVDKKKRNISTTDWLIKATFGQLSTNSRDQRAEPQYKRILLKTNRMNTAR